MHTKHPTDKIARRTEASRMTQPDRTRSGHPRLAAAAGHSPHALPIEDTGGTFDHGREA